MGRLLLRIGASAALAILAFSATATTPTIDDDSRAIGIATRLLDRLDAGDAVGATADFDVRMREALPEARLAQVVQQLSGAGPVQRRDAPAVSARDGGRVVVIRVHRALAALDATVTVDAQGQVTGLFFAPAAMSVPAAPPPAADARYTERDLAVTGPAGALPGTLTLPQGKGPFAAVVLVHGSGPQDRDETIGPNRPFLDIARGLAERGIASLRYEKRTFALRTPVADVDAETVDDAVAAIALLRATEGIDPARVSVFGHSLGAMLAPRIATRATGVDRLVLLATPSRPVLDVLQQQLRERATDHGPVTPEAQLELDRITAAVRRIRAGEAVPMNESPLGQSAAYWRSLDGVDPVRDARGIQNRMLVLHGDRDIQVTADDWAGWQKAFTRSPRVTLKRYPTLNHLGIAGTGAIADYQTPGHVDAGLLDDVAAWLKGGAR